jgi:hypothetical protein
MALQQGTPIRSPGSTICWLSAGCAPSISEAAREKPPGQAIFTK